MEGRITLVVITVDSCQPYLTAYHIAERVEGCDGSVAVDGCLSGNAHAVVVVSIVQAEIGKVAAFSRITAIGDILFLGRKATVHVGIYAIGVDIERSLSPTDAHAQIRLMGIVLLAHFSGGAVVSSVNQGAYCVVVIECGIQRTVGGEGCHGQLLGQPEGSRGSLQISCHGTGGMGCQQMVAATH